MGALIASPEGGDASVNVIPQMKKCSIISADRSKSFVSTMSQKNTINQSSLMPASNYSYINGMHKNEYSGVLLADSSVFDDMSSSTNSSNCQFPYYRSNKNSNRFSDAVLVKDVGVSCTLLNESIPEISIPETNNYLVKQLKKEYNDLSNITSKITAYTKDILNHLSKRSQKKNQLLQNLVSSKHATACQYLDSKGNLCLKLRLFNNVETQCNSQQIVKESNTVLFQGKRVAKNLHNQNLKSRLAYKDQMTICEENLKSKHEKEIQTILSEENVKMSISNSLSGSTSSVYNYLMMKKRKSWNELFKATFNKFNNMDKRQSYTNNKDCKNHLKRCSPVIFTNWKEISRSKRSRNKMLPVASDELRMANTRKKFLKKQFLDRDTINNVPDTRFHTVNIQIVKPDKKHV